MRARTKDGLRIFVWNMEQNRNEKEKNTSNGKRCKTNWTMTRRGMNTYLHAVLGYSLPIANHMIERHTKGNLQRLFFFFFFFVVHVGGIFHVFWPFFASQASFFGSLFSLFSVVCCLLVCFTLAHVCVLKFRVCSVFACLISFTWKLCSHFLTHSQNAKQ